MPDREKVIEGLECCSKGCSQNCPYFEIDGCNALLDNDALALLKEQEPIEPEVFMDGIIERYKCRRCGKHLIKTRFWKDNYCSLCGSEILWK